MRLRFAHRSLALAGPPCMMGIVNVTPDSFYDRGSTATPDRAVARGLELAEAGAGIIDIGGMTAQPGRVVSEDEEIARVVPVVVELRRRLGLPISIDTYRARVADAALRAGADLVNDHTGLSDADMAATIAGQGAGLVVTHLGLPPKQVQAARRAVAVDEIARFLAERADAARSAGIGADAGIEFAHRPFLALQDLQKAAIDGDQQAGDAQHGIVAPRRCQNMIKIAQTEFVRLGTDIEKLAHGASFPPAG